MGNLVRIGALLLVACAGLLPAQGMGAGPPAAERQEAPATPRVRRDGQAPPAEARRIARPVLPGATVRTGSDRRPDALFARYSWIVPATTGGKATLGLLLFAALAGAISLAVRIADLEDRELGRCCAQALVVAVMIAVHATVALSSPEAMLVAVAIDLVVWFVAARFFLGAGLSGGIIMLVSCGLTATVGILALEVAALVLDLTGAI